MERVEVAGGEGASSLLSRESGGMAQMALRGPGGKVKDRAIFSVCAEGVLLGCHCLAALELAAAE